MREVCPAVVGQAPTPLSVCSANRVALSGIELGVQAANNWRIRAN
jgi:hypothetical protein